MDLPATIERVKQAIASRRLQSEAAVRQAVVLPILRALGWDDLDPDRVTPEFELGGRRVDYALSALAGQPALFIEVKGPGPVIGMERQLFEYAFHAGIPFAVLTNGQEWSFFLPAAPGSYAERLLYKLDLSERETAEAVERLSRYLGFERVRSGKALRDANQDYNDLHSQRVVRDAMPRAWAQILAEPDAVIVDLLAERTATLCGFKPELELVAEFLAGVGAAPGRRPAAGVPPRTRAVGPASAPILTVTPPASSAPPEAAESQATKLILRPEAQSTGPLCYTFLGEKRTARSGNDLLLHVLRTLAGTHPDFLDRFARVAPGRIRNHIARGAEDVYPGQPQLVKYVVELVPGWYIGTNISNRDKSRLLRAGCQVAGLELGADLVVDLPNASE